MPAAATVPAEVRWAILGPGAIAANFARGLAETPGARLAAVAGRDAGRAQAFGARHGVAAADCHGDHAAALARADVDAVYIATIHTAHAQLVVDACAAGKHVLVEKPAGLNAAETRAIVDCARAAGVFFGEGYMYRFHPQVARLRELLAAGEIGTVRHVEATFGFAAPEDPASRLYDPEQAGGAILDVGGYPMSLARLVAGAVAGQAVAEPVRIVGTARRAATGVDAEARALVEFAGGLQAVCAAAIDRAIGEVARVSGTAGEIVMHSPWAPGREAGPADAGLTVTTAAGSRTETVAAPAMLFAYEARAATAAICAGQHEAAPLTWADTIGNSVALDAWRDAVGYVPPPERIAAGRRLRGVLPAGTMPRQEIDGVPVPVSKLVLGCDNQEREADGAIMWDAWLEAGGNAFDTAWIYGGGRMETLLGAWLRDRGVRDEVAIIVKGGHTPCCTPAFVRAQFEESLARLGTARADIYLLHRDNPDVPVGEFVDVLDSLAAAGRIGAFGGSNWSLARLREANAWARANGRRPFTALSNNLSLATMEQPVWPGCLSARDAATMACLRAEGIAHFAWSSQARGYFLPADVRGRLPAATGPEACFGSARNEARRARAAQVARARGVSANNVAAAWVLSQPFPSFALVGPRRPGELASSLPALAVRLAPEELAWLDEGGPAAPARPAA